MSITAIGAIISSIGNIIAGPIKRWQETKHAQHVAKIQRIQSGDTNAAELDRLSIASRGWKDEYLLIISTFPLVGIFIDPFIAGSTLKEGIEQGFITLDKMPEYYWYVLGIVYIDTFGFRQIIRAAVEAWLMKKFGRE